MKVTNGIKIAMANKPLCYKMLFSKIAIWGVCLLVCGLFAGILFNPFFESTEFAKLFGAIRELVKSVLHIEVEGTQLSYDLSQALKGVLGWFKANLITTIWVFAVIFVIYQLCRFLIGVCDYVMAVNVNEHMSSMRHAEFFTTLAEHLRPACAYGLYCIISLFLYNIVIYSVAILLLITLLDLIGALAITITMLFLVSADSFRLMIVGLVPAKMVCEKCGLLNAFRSAFKCVKFREMLDRFLSYFVMRVIVIIITIIATVVTFGVSLIISIPLFAVSYMSIRFVDYYTINHKKYYVTFDEIVIPKEQRSAEEQLLNKVDIDS